MDRRQGDPQDLDPAVLRRESVPVVIPLSQMNSMLARNLTRATWRGAIAGGLIAIVAAGLVGLFIIKPSVTHTVRRDVGNASVINCTNGRSQARALRSLLLTDADFNGQLGQQDSKSARIDHDLSRAIAALGQVIPTRIASDYQKQSEVFQRLSQLRARITAVWAGTKKHKIGSLAQNVLKATRARCDRILVDPGG